MNQAYKKDPLLFVYDNALTLLNDEFGAGTVKKEVEYYLSNKPSTLAAVYKQMVGSLKNKQGWVNFIAPTEEIKDILCNFDPHKVSKKYGNDYAGLFSEFANKYKASAYKFEADNKRNSWLQYSRGVLSSAGFLSSFGDFSEFDIFVQTFDLNEYTVAALPMLLAQEVHGFGFPLACDFLKEIGYRKYGKPDVHLMDIFYELGLIQERKEYETFKAIVKTAYLANTEPVIVDKIYWMIGSGKVEIVENKKIKSLKRQFISEMKQELLVNTK